MPATKQDRDIRKQLKNIADYTARLTKSTARLFLASGKEMIDVQMPTLVATYDTNKEVLDATIKFLRNPADAVQRGVQRGMETESYQSLQKTAKDMLADLKSGNLYDPNRDRSEAGAEIDDMLSSFGGMDWSFDENGDWADTGDDLTADLQGQAKIADVQEANASKRTAATIDAIGTSTEAITGTINANSQANIRISVKQHSEVMSALHNSLSVQTSQLSAISTGLTASMQVAKEAHSQMMAQMQTMTKLLEEIRDGVRVKETKKEYKDPLSPFGPSGEFSIKNYLKVLAKNADERFGISSTAGMISGGRNVKELVELVQDNPWMLVSSLILGQLVPERLKKQMTRTDTNLRNFIPALLDKLASRGNRTNQYGEVGIVDQVLSMFGVRQRSRTSIDTAIENVNQQAVFTRRTATAIEVVIPSLLSQINSSISGQAHQTFNYQSGKFERSTDVISRSVNRAHGLVGSMASAQDAIELGGRYNFRNSKEREEFQNYMYEYFHRIANDPTGSFINPYASKEDFMKTMPENTNKDYYYRLMMGVLRNMDRADLMAMSNDIFSARANRDRNNLRLNQELHESGQIGAFMGLAADEKLMSQLESKSKIARYGLSANQVTEIMNKRSKDARAQGGIQASNVILNDILSTLRRGIITYSFGAADMTADTNGNSALAAILRDQKSEMQLSIQIQSYLNREKELRDARIRSETEQNMSKYGGPQPTGKNLIDENMSMESAILEMAGIRANEANAKQSDNPNVRWMRSMNDRLSGKASEVLDKTGVLTIWDRVRRMTSSPFAFMEESLRTVDAFMFKMLYGEDAAVELENGGQPSLMKSVTNAVKVQFMDAKNWFKVNIGDPLRKMLFDNKDGIIPRIGRSIKENLIDPITKPIKERIGKVKDRVRQKIIGKKDDESGEYSGGVLSGAANKFNKYTKEGGVLELSLTNAINRILYGNLVNEKGRREYEMAAFDPEKGFTSTRDVKIEYSGVVGKFRRAFDSVGRFFFGDDYGADDVTKAENARSRRLFKETTKELGTAAPKMAAGAGLGLLASFFLPGGPLLGSLLGSFGGLISGSKKFSEYLLGPFAEQEEIMTDTKGKPIKDKDGNVMTKKVTRRQGGIISKEVSDGLQRFVPGVSKGMLAGAVAGGLGLLPFGLGSTAGMVIGAVGGMSATSETIKKLIFGDGVDPKSGMITKEFREKVKSQVKNAAGPALGGAVLGNMAWGAISGLGLIPGLSLLPGGPIFTLLGAITGASNADTIKKFLFGEEVEADETVTEPDPNDPSKTITKTVHKRQRQGGVFGKIFDFAQSKIVDPLAKRVDNAGKKINDWFKDSIIKPLRNAMEPGRKAIEDAWENSKQSLKNIGQAVLDGIGNAIGVSFNGEDGTGGLSAFIRDKVIKPLDKFVSKIFGAIGKAIGNVISAPFKVLEFMLPNKDANDLDDQDKNLTGRERRRKRRAERRKKRREKNRAKRRERVRNRFYDFLGHFGIKRPGEEESESGQAIPLGPSSIFEPTGAGVMDADYVQTPEDESDDMADAVPGAKPEKDKNAPRVMDAATIKAIQRHERKKMSQAYREKDKARKEQAKQAKAAADQGDTKRRSVRPKKTNNEYLERIDKRLKQIFDEIKGQVNGVGWNTAYIKTLLEKQFGQSLSDDELPEEMEGSKKTIRKRRTFIGRAIDRVKGFGQGIKDRFDAGVDWVKDRVFAPIYAIADFVGGVMSTANKVRKGLWKGVKTVGKAVGGAAKGVGGFLWDLILDLKDITATLVKGAAAGLANGFRFVTGVLADAGRLLSATATGLLETAIEIAPDIAAAAWSGIKKVGGGLWAAGKWALGKGVKALGKLKKGVTGGVKWAFNKIFHRGDKSGSGLPSAGDSSGFRLNGGYLDSITDSVHIQIGPKAAPVDYPVIDVIRGKALTMRRMFSAIPVFLVGSSPDNLTNVYVKNEHTPSKGNIPTPNPAQGGPANGTTIGDNQNQFRINGYQSRNRGLDHSVHGDNAGVQLSPAKAQQEENRRKHKEKVNFQNTFKRVFRRMYKKADRAAETASTGNVGEVYDRMIENAASMEEVEAIRTANELNGGTQLAIASGANGAEDSSGGGLLSTIMNLLGGGGGIKNALLSFAGKALPMAASLFALNYGLKTEGEGHIASNAFGNILKSGLKSTGLGRLSFNEIKNLVDDPTLAKTFASEFTQEAAEAGTKRAAKSAAQAARGITSTGSILDFFKMIRDPEYAEAASSAASIMGGKVNFFTKLKTGAASIIRKAGSGVSHVLSNAKDFVTSAGKSIGSKVSSSAVGQAASSGLSGLKSKAKTLLEGALKKFLNLAPVKALMGSTLTKKISSIISTVSKELFGTAFEKAAKTVGSETVQSALKAVAGIATSGVVTVAFAVTDFITGYNSANTIFNIHSSQVTGVMKFISGLIRALTGLVGTFPGVGTMVSIALSFAEDPIVQALYSLLADKEAQAELAENQAKAQAAADEAGVSVDEYVKNYNEDGTKKKKGIVGTVTSIAGGALKAAGNTAVDALAGAANMLGSAASGLLGVVGSVTGGAKNLLFGSGRGLGTGWGTGVKQMSQRSGKYNKTSRNMALAGCGPVSAAMVGSAYGDNRSPMVANNMSYNMGMRARDGGTNPAFFSQYANSFGAGYGMSEGPVDNAAITANLKSGQPVILMGRGGAFGGHMHYMVADGTDGRGGVSFVDPMTGARRNGRMHDIVQNTKSAVYSYGTGTDDLEGTTGEDKTKEAQALLVSKMIWLKNNPITYSLEWDKQDPDKGAASCASTVGWAYRKVLGLTGMSANSQAQSKDDRFTDIVRLGQPGAQPGKTFDTSILEPGDIVYMFNKWNGGSSNHTEMYIGDGKDLSHGGPDPGPQERKLDATRQKKVWAVRRYKGFVDDSTPVNISEDAYTNTGSESGGFLSKLFGGVGSFFKNVFNTVKGGLSGLSDGMKDLFGNLLGAIWGPKLGIDTSSLSSGSSSSSSGGITSNTSTASLSGSTNGKKIFSYLIGKGLTKNQAAGVMGNLNKESGLIPTNLQNSYESKLGYTDDSYTKAVDSGNYSNFDRDSAGYGLAQWTYWSRKQKLRESAEKSGKSIGDLGLQLDYLWDELNSSYKTSTLEPLKKASSIRDATKIFLQEYERPAGYKSEDKVNERTKSAEEMLKLYGSGPGLPTWKRFGTGDKSAADANIDFLEEKVRRLNKMITTTQQDANEAQATDVANNIQNTIAQAGAGVGTSDVATLEVLKSIATSINTMVQLLQDIKQNTTPAAESSTTTTTSKYSNLPVAENGSGMYSTDQTTQYQSGADIINWLTSK